jgi:hypothetical protein
MKRLDHWGTAAFIVAVGILGGYTLACMVIG